MKDDPNEIFDLVDEADQVIGVASRQTCNSNPNLFHRASFVLVYNRRDEMLWQRRSLSKDTEPGKWTVSASGHVNAGEDYEQAAVRELKEELGLEADVEFLGKDLFRYESENEWTAIFRSTGDGPFAFPLEEISEVRFMTVKEALRQERDGEIELAEAVHRVREAGYLEG